MFPDGNVAILLSQILHLFIIFSLVMQIFNFSFDAFSMSNRAQLIESIVKGGISAVPSMILSTSFVVAPNPIFSIISGPASVVDLTCQKCRMLWRSVIFSI